MRRSAARPTTDLTAYDLYLRALAAYFPASKESASKALSLLEQAIAIDRITGGHFPGQRYATEYWRLTAGSKRRMQVVAKPAILPGKRSRWRTVTPQFSVTRRRSGGVWQDIGVPMALVDRALALNPSDARCWYASGVVRLWAGEPDLAISHIETSLRLSPRERTGTPQTRIGEAHFFKRRFDEAASTLLLSMEENLGAPVAHRFLAACYAHRGRLDEARAIIARLRAVTAEVVPGDLPYRNPEHRELLLSGLRLAAGETTSARPIVSADVTEHQFAAAGNCRSCTFN